MGFQLDGTKLGQLSTTILGPGQRNVVLDNSYEMKPPPLSINKSVTVVASVERDTDNATDNELLQDKNI